MRLDIVITSHTHHFVGISVDLFIFVFIT